MDIKTSEYDLGNMDALCMETLASAIEFKTNLFSGKVDIIAKLARRLKVKRHDKKKRTDFRTADQLCNLIALELFGKPCDEIEGICSDHKVRNPFITDDLMEEAKLAAAIRYHLLRDKPKTYIMCGIKTDVLYRAVQSLDMYSRMGMGQLWVIESELRVSGFFGGKKRSPKYEDVTQLVNRLTSVLYGFPYPNMAYGIHGREVPTECKLAYDIQQVVRHRLAWDSVGNPPARDWSKMMGCSFDNPTNISGLPLITIVGSDGLVKTAY